MTDRYIVYNALRTPDGTIIESHYTHDYVTHIDKNGKEYMVDGGNSYIRRSKNGDEEDLSIYSDSPHSIIREYITWGTYGKNGDQPLQRKRLSELSNNHINAILDTQTQIPKHYRTFFETELEYRKSIGLEVFDE